MSDGLGGYERQAVEYSRADDVHAGEYGLAPAHISNVSGSATLVDPSGAGDNPKAVDTASYAFHSQYTSITQPQQRPEDAHASSTYGANRVVDSGTSTFNLGLMASALPDYAAPGFGYMPAQQYQSPRVLPSLSSPFPLHQLPQLSPYPGPGAYSHGHRLGHANGQHAAAAFIPGHSLQSGGHPYSTYSLSHQRPAGLSPLQQSFLTFPQQLYYYPNGYDSPSQLQQTPTYARSSNIPLGHGRVSSHGTLLSTGFSRSEQLGFGMDVHGGGALRAATEGIGRQGSESSLNSAIPRGPPRKPKQSGHALWVGNLPPGTTVMDLKDHFSREAMRDIESLFLISKSNCAFVNYKSEAACIGAMNRFHDSRFNGVRLVCRLRRGSASPALNVPVGPAAMTRSSQAPASPSRSLTRSEEEMRQHSDHMPGELVVEAKISEKPGGADRFFIVKSLTLQDLEVSAKNGIWATQTQNEGTLNRAFESADNVYLIFSANKSGAYFGYGRMASAIGDDGAQSLPGPTQRATEPSEGPRSIPTPATEHAPRGRIIDDSARGTIFWEADSESSDEEGKDLEESVGEAGEARGNEGPTIDQAWGKPFKIEWINTNRLPFYRTRGLRNPWNANREVKIARDGTELETSVGNRLIQMFHKVGPVPPLLRPMGYSMPLGSPETAPY